MISNKIIDPNTSILRPLCIVLLIIFLWICLTPKESQSNFTSQNRANNNFLHLRARIPSNFIENKGQYQNEVKFSMARPNGSVLFTQSAILYPSLCIEFLGANKEGEIRGTGNPQEQNNYFIGNDPKKWIRNAKSFNKLVYSDLYPNIDLHIHAGEEMIKLEFHVHKGGDSKNIQMKYKEANKLHINRRGRLKIITSDNIYWEEKPFTFQVIKGHKVKVKAGYTVENGNTVGFRVGEYNNDRTLIIDPSLEYSSLIGGKDEEMAWIIATDLQGNAYVAGETYKGDYPSTTGAYDTNFSGEGDIFVSKFDPTGSHLIYSTFIGGSNDHPNGVEGADGIAVDDSGHVYITGWTSAIDFPTTTGAFDRTFNGGGDEYYIDAFVTKLDPSGSDLVFSTYLGGSKDEWGNGLAIDNFGHTYIVGVTYSSNFPVTPGAIDTSHNGGIGDAFVTKLDPAGSELVYSTMIGGSQWEEGGSITLDVSGNAYISGYTESDDFPTTSGAFDTSYNGGDGDGYVSKLNPSGSTLLYSTFLGGSGQDSCDDDGGDGIRVDKFGNTYVVGETESDDFPVTPGAFDTTSNGRSDAFITALNASGSDLLFSTYLGGSKDEKGNGIIIDPAGGVYLIGDTKSDDFPVTQVSIDSSHNGRQDVFAAKLISSGSNLVYSTFLGGSKDDECDGIAVDKNSNIFLTGWTRSNDFPTTQNAYDRSHNGMEDVFVSKISMATPIVSGTVSSSQPIGIDGVSLQFSNAGGTAVTDASGYYSHSVNPGWSGSVTPSKLLYMFIPKKRIYSDVRSDIQNQDFKGELVIFSDQTPLNFNGIKIENRSLAQIEYINVLNWQANPNHIDVVGYRIYSIDGNRQFLLAEINAPIHYYWHRNIRKEKKYEYALVAVNREGKESLPAYTEVW